MSHHLPIEVISVILQYIEQQHTVYQVSLVSRHYYNAAQRHLWRFPRPDSSARLLHCLKAAHQPMGEWIRTLQFGRDEPIETMHEILKLAPALETIRFMTTPALNDSNLNQLAQHLSNLTSLTLCYVNLTHLEPIGLYCKQLDTLALVSCPDFTPCVFSGLSSKLEHIKISDCHWLTATETAHDLGRFNLITLELEDCGRTDGKFVASLTQFPRLKRFSLVGDVGFQWSYQSDVNHAVIMPFLLAHPHLHTLKLKFCTIDDATLITIATTLLELQVLSLRGCTGLSPHAVRQMVLHTSITVLDMSGAKIEARWFPESGKAKYLGLLSRPCLDLVRAHPDFVLLD